jgi:hypothetical protein
MSPVLTLLDAFLSLGKATNAAEKVRMDEAAEILAPIVEREAMRLTLGNEDDRLDCAQYLLRVLCERTPSTLNRLRETMVSEGQVVNFIKTSLLRRALDVARRRGRERTYDSSEEGTPAHSDPVLPTTSRDTLQAWGVLRARVVEKAARRKRKAAAAALRETFDELDLLAKGTKRIEDLLEPLPDGLNPDEEFEARKRARNKVDMRLSRARKALWLAIDIMQRTNEISVEDANALRAALDAGRTKAKPQAGTSPVGRRSKK